MKIKKLSITLIGVFCFDFFFFKEIKSLDIQENFPYKIENKFYKDKEIAAALDVKTDSQDIYRSGNLDSDTTSWYLSRMSDGSFRIENKFYRDRKEAALLDAHGESDWVYRSPYGGDNPHTRWYLNCMSDGSFQIESKFYRDRKEAAFLDAHGESDRVYHSHYGIDNPHTRWYLNAYNAYNENLNFGNLNFIEKEFERDRNSVTIRNFMRDRGIENRPINVLSIDGGGVRGIIPAIFLQMLEEKTGRRVRDLFDLFVGTSTGAILCLGLTTRKKDDDSFRTASEMVEIYEKLSSDIFPSNWFLKPIYFIPSIFWWGSEYSEKPLEDKLNEILGDTELKQVSIPTVATSVDAEHNTLKLFRSYRASWQETENFYVRDVARATSAAPTFFPIKRVKAVNSNSNYTISLVDGGMAANNPSSIALSEAFNLFGLRQINLVSLGTGSSVSVHNSKDVAYIRRASPTIEMLFDAQSHTVDRTIDDLSESVDYIKYHRVQITLEENLMQLDNAGNLAKLSSKARDHFGNGEGKKDIDYVANLAVGTIKQRGLIH